MATNDEDTEQQNNAIVDRPASPDVDLATLVFNPMATKCLVVSRLPNDVTEEGLHEYYGRYGNIRKLVIKRNFDPLFCYLYYASVVSIFQALKYTNRAVYHGATLYVGAVKAKPGRHIWLGVRTEAPSPILEGDHLLDYMLKYGYVKSLVVSRNYQQAVVSFELNEAAQKAVEGLKGLEEFWHMDVKFASTDFLEHFMMIATTYRDKPDVLTIPLTPEKGTVLTDPRSELVASEDKEEKD